MRVYKSPFDDAKFDNPKSLERYVINNYKDKIPSYYNGDVAHFLYDFRNEPRKCQVCGVKTQWNKKKEKYNVLCSIPEEGSIFEMGIAYFRKAISFFKNKGNSCEAVMRKQYLKNIRRTHNTDNLMKDDEYQKYLLNFRKISKVVEYKGIKYTAVGSYEEAFVLELDAANRDINLVMPGPTIKFDDTYTITDAFIPEYNLIISIKDGGNNPNYKDNYIKSCKGYYHAIQKGYKMIELNGIDEVSNCMTIIDDYLTNRKTEKDVCPKYMKKYTPELYDKLK